MRSSYSNKYAVLKEWALQNNLRGVYIFKEGGAKSYYVIVTKAGKVAYLPFFMDNAIIKPVSVYC